MLLKNIPTDLIESSKNGDEKSLELLIEIASPLIYNFILYKVKNHNDADDILQETLIRLYLNIKLLKDTKSFAGWIKKIAVNQANTFYVSKKSKKCGNISFDDMVFVEDSEKYLIDNTNTVENIINKINNEQHFKQIKRAMKKLTKPQKIITTLYYIENFSIKEISKKIGITQGAVKFHMHRSRKKLKEIITQQKDLN